MKYALFNPADTNAITPVIGWFDTDFADYTLPTMNSLATVPDTIWEDNQGRSSGAYSVDKSQTPPAIVSTPAPAAAAVLEQAQAGACNQIDAATGQARAKYVTVTSMQSAVYEMKYDEAVAYQAAPSPVATDYPHLNAEATQTNIPIATVAANVISTRNAWVQVSAKIEGYRLGGKAAVNAAMDAADVQAALTTALANLESC